MCTNDRPHQSHEFFKTFRDIFYTFCIFAFVFDVQNRSKNRRKIVPWGRLEAPRGPSRGLPEAVHRRFQGQLTMNERNERFRGFLGSEQPTDDDDDDDDFFLSFSPSLLTSPGPYRQAGR